MLYKLFVRELAGEKTVLLHCAAGIHRTGTMAYTIMRLSGYSAEEAMGNLKVMREDTWKGVGDWRIELAEKQIYPRVQALIDHKGGGTDADPD